MLRCCVVVGREKRGVSKVRKRSRGRNLGIGRTIIIGKCGGEWRWTNEQGRAQGARNC